MGFIRNDKKILRKEINQRKGRAACFAQGKMTGIVFDARTEAHFSEHFQIIIRALLQSLRFQKLVLSFELRQALLQLLFNPLNGELHFFGRGDIMRRGENRDMVSCPDDFACQHIYFRNTVDFIPEKFHTNGMLRRADRENFDHIPTDTKRTSFKIQIIAVILHFHQSAQDFIPVLLHAGAQGKHHAVVFLRVTQAINTGNAGNNNNILSLHQRRRGGMAQLINFIIDRGILFDIGIRTGYIRLRLIIVIIADEILHRIFGEKLLQLVIKLCRKGFIVRNDQGRLLDFLNDICHGKGFARTCNPQQGLEFQALLKALRNFFNRLRLITGRFIFRYHLKFVLHFSSSR